MIDPCILDLDTRGKTSLTSKRIDDVIRIKNALYVYSVLYQSPSQKQGAQPWTHQHIFRVPSVRHTIGIPTSGHCWMQITKIKLIFILILLPILLLVVFIILFILFPISKIQLLFSFPQIYIMISYYISSAHSEMHVTMPQRKALSKTLCFIHTFVVSRGKR